jgi:hypothetical protein
LSLVRDAGYFPAEEDPVEKALKVLVCTVGALCFALSGAPRAMAACGSLNLPSAHPAEWHQQFGKARFLLTAKDSDDDGAIVGMWHVKFTAQTVNGTPIPDTVIDNALVVWHSDNTEIMNSGRPPQDGDFCMGVWERAGHRSYNLNHFAWGGNTFPNNPPVPIGDPAGPTRIVEHVTLDSDGDRYTGTFSLDAYDTSGNLAMSFTGVITATRITINTAVNDLAM